MNKERIIRLLEDQLRFAKEQNQLLSRQLSSQSSLIDQLSHQVETLTYAVASLEEALQAREASLGKVRNTSKGLSKLLGNKSEKISPAVSSVPDPVKKEIPSPAQRGNNGSRRKEYFELEVKHHHIYPEVPGFSVEESKLLKTADSIRYEYMPPRFIKHIHHLHYYQYQGNVIYGKLPSAPLLNSNYDASFLAGILQMRYIYALPVERIVKFFTESGFEIKKSTAHHLVKKAAEQFDYLQETLHQAILEDTYIHMDETYYTILEQAAKSVTGKASCKGYIWSALAHTHKLVQFFYQDGSRAGKMLTRYVKPGYQGAIQSDGFACYKILETDQYPHTIRLACFQHCKRKFLDIQDNADARDVVGIINKLYQQEHKAPPEQRMRYRQTYAPPIFKELKEKLLEIKNKKTTLPKSNLAKAVDYTLNEYPALCNYMRKPEYELDNNAIERVNRYISLSRRNSLFCGSHQGANRAALIYSLACSCKLNGINTFEYFKELLNKLIRVNPNTDKGYLRSLLPDKCGK